MVKVYTIGDSIPNKIKDKVEDWNYWIYILVANSTTRNNDTKFLANTMNVRRWEEVTTEDGYLIRIAYTI